jgi:hypothetical protein
MGFGCSHCTQGDLFIIWATSQETMLMPTLDKDTGSNFLRTNLDWSEANWILELDYTLVPRLILGSLNGELSFLALFFGLTQLIFPPKQVPCRFSLNLSLFGLGPSSKSLGTNLKRLTNKIAWVHWSLDLGPLSKVALNILLCLTVGLFSLMLHSYFVHPSLIKPTFNCIFVGNIQALQHKCWWCSSKVEG